MTRKTEEPLLTPAWHLEEWRLVRCATDGNMSAFGSLYDRYRDAVFRYVHVRGCGEAESELLTEAVFVRAWEGLPRDLSSADHSFATWLFKLADVFMEAAGAQGEREALHGIAETVHGKLKGQDDVKGPRCPVDLVKGVRQLSETERRIVILRFVEGLSHQEIATILGESEETLRLSEYRALTALQDELGEMTVVSAAFTLERYHTVSYCLDQIVAGRWTAEECVRRLPTHGEELLRFVRLALRIRELRNVRPRPLFRRVARHRLAKRLRKSKRTPASDDLKPAGRLIWDAWPPWSNLTAWLLSENK